MLRLFSLPSHLTATTASVVCAHHSVTMLSKKDMAPAMENDAFSRIELVLQSVWQSRDSRRIMMYIMVSFVVMVMELWYGVSVSSLGLINDGFHMMFNCVALSITLGAMVLARRGPTFAYTYGFDRHEVVAAFTNSMFLLFVSCFLALESLHRVVNPVTIVGARLIEVSVAGLAVNLLGAVAFKTENTWLGRMARLSTSTSNPVAHRANLQAAYLLVFADTASSIGVVLNSVLVYWKGYMVADPLIALVVAGLTLYSTFPLFVATAQILLQTTPKHLKGGLERCRREVTTIPGVLECKDEHFWTQAPGFVVGSVVVRVQSDANEQDILTTVSAKFSRLVQHMTVQIEKDPPLDWLLPATNGEGGDSAAIGTTSTSTGHHDHHDHPDHGDHHDHGEHGHGHGHGHGHAHSHGGDSHGF